MTTGFYQMREFPASLCLFIFMLVCAPFNAFGVEVSAQGINHRQALNNALRQAVEMTMGTNVESNTLVENFQVVRQQILSHTRGFVKSYTILKEEQLDQGAVSLTIEATVDEKNIEDSAIALATLMKMATHPRILVAARDDDFDAISSLSDEFRLLSETVENILHDDFHFDILDSEATRLLDQTNYRFSDRKNNLKRARRSGADFVVFVELLKGHDAPYTLRLESIDVASGQSIDKRETDFSMAGWTRDIKNNRKNLIRQAKEHIYGPSAQIGAALITTLHKEVYEDGQRYALDFQRFDPKLIEFLETDLTNLGGYVRHKITYQKKNALSLSYWSLLKPGALNEEISSLLQAKEIPFDFNVQNRQLSYRFDDPIFE